MRVDDRMEGAQGGMVVKGGWPDAIDLTPEQASRIAKGYLQAVIEEDIHEVDGIERDKDKVRKLTPSHRHRQSDREPRAIRRESPASQDPERGFQRWIPWVFKTSDDQRSLTTAMV